MYQSFNEHLRIIFNIYTAKLEEKDQDFELSENWVAVETETKAVCDIGAQQAMFHGGWHAKHFWVND